MVKLYDFKETAVFAWSHDNSPLIATGTLAGVMDDNFSSDSSLSIYDPFSKKSDAIFKADAPAKFNSFDWSKPTDSYKRGLLAGALENSTIELWDADKLLSSSSSSSPDLKSASVATYSKHTTPVLNVSFNPLQSHILGSSASKGEIFIWDTNKGTSFNPGQAMSPMSKISCLEWNNSMSHIFGTAGDSGYASIWDLKAKREVLQLTYSGLNMSVLQWHPNQSTKLVTATDSDNEPLILTWDLRNSSAPEKICKGHKKGILSLDWCKQDPTLLLSSGKDDTTKLWNPIEGIEIATYPSLPNWVQQTKFAPKLPEVFASASLSKNVVIQSLQDTSEPVSVKVQSQNDDDFWNQISTTETQKPTFHVSQAPVWLKRPISASFGFGGKLVVTEGKNIKIVSVAKNGEMDKAAKGLISALSGNDFKSICQSKIKSQIKLEEGKDWELLSELLENGKDKIINELLPKESESESELDSPIANDNEDEDEDDFFAQLGSAKKVENKTKYVPSGEFKLFGNSTDSTFENEAIKLILNNKTEDALDLCISNEKLLEALIIAMNGSESMKTKARGAYFAKYATESSFSRLLYSASTTDVTDVVQNAEIDESSWKTVLKSIVSFSNDTPKFNEQMKLLGDRLIKSDLPNARDNAFKCYAAADALGKISAIWLDELNDYEQFYLTTSNEDGSKNTSFEARFKALGEVIEKTIVFESVSKSDSSSGLEPLGKAFQEYANYLANFGHFELAYKILEKANESIPGIKEEKNRISKAFLKTATAKASAKTAKSYNLNTKYNMPSTSTPAAAPSSIPNPYSAPLVPNSVVSPPNPYAVPAVQQNAAPAPPSVGSHMPVPGSQVRASTNRPINRYAPSAAIESLQNPASIEPSLAMPPPPPPSKKKDVGGWNDLPVNLANTPRTSSQKLPTAYSTTPLASATSNSPPVNGLSKPNAVPPPPSGHSRTPSATVRPQVTMRSSSRNPYEPKPEVVEPVRVPSNIASPIVPQMSQLPPSGVAKVKNPYAPKSDANPLSNSPLSSNNGFNAPVSNGNVNGSAPPPPKKNVYAPPQAAVNAVGNNPYAPSSKIPTGPPSHNPYAPSNVSSGMGDLNTALPPPPKSNSVLPPPRKSVVAPPPPPPAATQVQASPVPSQAEPQKIFSPQVESIKDILSRKLEDVKPGIPEKFQKQVQDSEKRLNILFTTLNKDELEETTVNTLFELANALNDGEFTKAKESLAIINETEGGKWLAGVKRLIGMAEATKE